jgi:hypothetical protein
MAANLHTLSTTFLIRYVCFSDRKPEDLFVIKSFIFSNVPGEWSFGALEMLHGMQQIIDITDDTTGTPTSTARKEIPMYGKKYDLCIPSIDLFVSDFLPSFVAFRIR